MSTSQLGHIHLSAYLTLPGPLHHQPIHPVQLGRHRHPSWVHCKTEQCPSCPEPSLHCPNWDDCSPACGPDCHPSLPGSPPGTGHCHTAAALQGSAFPSRGRGVVGRGWRWTGGTNYQGVQKRVFIAKLWEFIGWNGVLRIWWGKCCH